MWLQNTVTSPDPRHKTSRGAFFVHQEGLCSICRGKWTLHYCRERPFLLPKYDGKALVENLRKTVRWAYLLAYRRLSLLNFNGRQAVYIIYLNTRGMFYPNIYLPPLSPKLTNFQGHFSKTHLSAIFLPLSFASPVSDTSVLSRLRTATGFTCPVPRTEFIVLLY